MQKGCKISENILVLQKKGKFKLWFLHVFMQKGGKIAENILGKGVLFNSQNDDGVPIFHGSAGTGENISLISWISYKERIALFMQHGCGVEMYLIYIPLEDM